MPSHDVMIKDLQDFTTRLQQQINDISATISDAPPSDAPLDDFEERVWESVLSVIIGNMTNPNQILPSDPAIQQKMMVKALRLADQWVAAAKAYKDEKALQKKEHKPNDPIKALLKD